MTVEQEFKKFLKTHPMGKPIKNWLHYEDNSLKYMVWHGFEIPLRLVRKWASEVRYGQDT